MPFSKCFKEMLRKNSRHAKKYRKESFYWPYPNETDCSAIDKEALGWVFALSIDEQPKFVRQ
jgi:hypothetical protein